MKGKFSQEKFHTGMKDLSILKVFKENMLLNLFCLLRGVLRKGIFACEMYEFYFISFILFHSVSYGFLADIRKIALNRTEL